MQVNMYIAFSSAGQQRCSACHPSAASITRRPGSTGWCLWIQRPRSCGPGLRFLCSVEISVATGSKVFEAGALLGPDAPPCPRVTGRQACLHTSQHLPASASVKHFPAGPPHHDPTSSTPCSRSCPLTWNTLLGGGLPLFLLLLLGPVKGPRIALDMWHFLVQLGSVLLNPYCLPGCVTGKDTDRIPLL